MNNTPLTESLDIIVRLSSILPRYYRRRCSPSYPRGNPVSETWLRPRGITVNAVLITAVSRGYRGIPALPITVQTSNGDVQPLKWSIRTVANAYTCRRGEWTRIIVSFLQPPHVSTTLKISCHAKRLCAAMTDRETPRAIGLLSDLSIGYCIHHHDIALRLSANYAVRLFVCSVRCLSRDRAFVHDCNAWSDIGIAIPSVTPRLNICG